MVEPTSPRMGHGRLAGLRVLIAEDSWLIADTLSVLLEEEGAWVVGRSASCAGAIGLLRQATVDFALIDMGLTDSFADQLAVELVKRSVPFAIVTGYGALPSNADEHAVKVIHKPIEKQVLVDLLSGYVAR
jgi:two-component SAPR family response regulator